MPESVILIVDDDRTIVQYCKLLLERAAYQVISATKPVDALLILEDQKVDLLLSDIMMPVMDGFELIARAKQYQPGLPVLVMTGFASIDIAIQALHRGVDGLIIKPFENSSDLVQAVERVLTTSRQRQDAARLQVLRPLFDLSETLLAETSPQSLAILILDAIHTLFKADSAGIFRQSPGGNWQPVRLMEDDEPVDDAGQSLIELLYEVVSQEPVQMVHSIGPGSSDIQPQLHALSWETVLVAQVKRNEQHFIFYAARKLMDDAAVRPQPFAGPDEEMFVILARQAAVALENARLYSELKDYVHRVEESQRALIQAEKMAAVGRLMASLAHEINNPLQAVRNSLHLASIRNINETQRFNYLDMSRSELERLVNTVRRMLDFSRVGNVDKEWLDLEAIISRVLALLKPQLAMLKIQVVQQKSGPRVEILGVSDQIQQVLFNLILNAMDALENEMGEKQIWIDLYYQEQQVKLYIEDSGPGIPDELHARIFEPFISTKKNGTGLGLSVSYGIVERHRGSLIDIEPRYGRGACFEIILPVEHEE